MARRPAEAAPTAETSGASSTTLQDVATQAGVSLATASRVLNGSSRKVAQHYRERVLGAAEYLGYAANVAAQAVARGSSNIVTLLVADIADPYFGQIAAGVERGAREQGLIVSIATTRRESTLEREVLRTIRGQAPRGIVLASSRDTREGTEGLEDELTELHNRGSRIVTFGPEAGSDRVIEIDNRGSAHELGATVWELGYRHAVVLAAAEGLTTSDDRLGGFAAGFGERGGRIDTVYRGAFSRDGGYEMMSSALGQGVPRGTIVLGISDVVAIGAMAAIRDSGGAVGVDYGVVGFDDIVSAKDVTPALTTVRLPLEQFGYDALRAVVDDSWQPRDGYESAVVVRESTPQL